MSCLIDQKTPKRPQAHWRCHLLLATLASAVSVWSLTAMAQTVTVGAERLLDVTSGTLLEHPVITIVDGKITRIEQGTVNPKNPHTVVLPGVTLLPGFIDMHVHLTADPRYNGYRGLEFTDNFWTIVGAFNAKKTLEAGFTTVRNVGSSNYDDVAMKQAIEQGFAVGPRIVPATYAIGATGGHCDATEFPPSVSVPTPAVADGPQALRKVVRTLRKYGAEVIKFCGTGGVFSKTDSVGGEQYGLDEMTTIVEEAHRLGMRVAVHAHGAIGIKDAIRAGVDTIEHASLADQEAFELAKAHGTYFSMDVYDDDYILAEGEKNGTFKESLEKERSIGRLQRETFKAATAYGVKMVFGTDGGVYPNGDNAKQFKTMVDWGMTPLQAIQSATLIASQALGRADQVGTIAVGHWGDLVGIKGDVLKDVTLLQHPVFVMKGGEVIVHR